jgi:predicted RNA-binding Zn ribbon-like protein
MSDRAPAPGRLSLVQEFVNTNEIDENRDDLAQPDGLREWLVQRALLGPDTRIEQADVDRAIAVREAIRGLALANNGGPLYPVDLATLNRAAAEMPLRLRFQPGGAARLEPTDSGINGALVQVLTAVFAAMAEGTWPRFKACRKHDCRWAFYDQSKNHSGTWCSMAVCGNRVKATSYRKRRGGHQTQ